MLTIICGGDIMKSKKRKFLSGVAAFMTLFGAGQKSNVQAMKPTTKNTIKNTIVNIAIPTAIIGSITAAIALPVHFSRKSEQERRQREEEEKKKILESRDDAIKKSNGYIKNLATELKEMIPLSNQGLFDNLSKCGEDKQLRDWQHKVVKETSNGNLNSKTLEKIIDELYRHWSKVYEERSTDRNWISNQINGELAELRRKLDSKKQEEFNQAKENHLKEMRKIEKEKLKIEKQRLDNQINKKA